MAVRQIDLGATELAGGVRSVAFGAGTAVTRSVRVSWDNGIRRDRLQALLRLGWHTLIQRLRADNEAAGG